MALLLLSLEEVSVFESSQRQIYNLDNSLFKQPILASILAKISSNIESCKQKQHFSWLRCPLVGTVKAQSKYQGFKSKQGIQSQVGTFFSPSLFQPQVDIYLHSSGRLYSLIIYNWKIIVLNQILGALHDRCPR